MSCDFIRVTTVGRVIKVVATIIRFMVVIWVVRVIGVIRVMGRYLGLKGLL